MTKQNILEKERYRYWDGKQWTEVAERAAPIVAAPVAELSIRWNSHYRKWILMTKHQEKHGDGHGIVLRTADCLTGPWSEERWVLTDEEVPRLYAPYMPPKWQDGADIYFTLSRFDLYDVFWWHTSLQGGDRGKKAKKCIVK